MKVQRFAGEVEPERIRGLVPPARSVEADVRAILDGVRRGGDAAVASHTAQFDRAQVPPERLRVEPREIEAAQATLDHRLEGALRTVMANVRSVAQAQLHHDVAVDLPEGHRVEVVEVPVARAAAYVPGGRAPYPSTLVMCAVTARVAGVPDLAVCAPPGRDGNVDPLILAACGLCGVGEVYRMGGAQSIAALAFGTESVPPVDVIVGPGSTWVQEAKRQVNGVVGIDGPAGPSELVIVATAGAEPELLALDLLAQAEHGPESLLALISPDRALLAAVEEEVARRLGWGGGVRAAGRPRPPASVHETPLAMVLAPDARSAVRLADAIAPEHLELAGRDAEALAGAVRQAGCLFVGRGAATAFGDYVAGSNHVLPTGGAARFASGLSVATFRRRMSRVALPEGAARRLAPSGAALAIAEGFPLHAESMARRA